MCYRRDLGRNSILVLALFILPAFTGTGLVAAVVQAGEEPPERIIAIGDLHGDLEATRAALRLAGVIDEEDRWVGGRTVVVQTGDILDRGDQEEGIMTLLQNLIVPADEAGGAVHLLNGNHELMNAYLDYRYVTTKGLTAFPGLGGVDASDTALSAILDTLPPFHRHRAAVFHPGGDGARFLALRKTAVKIGNTVFVHGGILPEQAEMGLDRMNAAVRSWLLGEIEMPEWIRGDRSPVWTRLYSDAPNLAACDTLSAVLEELKADRMVVGHTPQATGITAYCGGRVWCIDVGMAASYEGSPEVLVIEGDVVRSLRGGNSRKPLSSRIPDSLPLLGSHGPFPQEQPPGRPPIGMP